MNKVGKVGDILYGIISPRSLEAIEDKFGSATYCAYSDLHQSLLQATRIQLEFIIIDIDMPGQWEEEIHQYRVQRPDTRLILLAPGRVPGDPSVAKLVALGIYDIASDPDGFISELIELIEKPSPSGYAQAARWVIVGQPLSAPPHTPHRKSHQDSNQSSPERPILIQQRPLGLITIAIAGAGPGAGTSHVSLAVCSYLARNNRVLLAEWPLGLAGGAKCSQYFPYAAYVGAKEDIRIIQGINMHFARVHGFDIFSDARSLKGIDYIFPFAVQGRYEYLVLDLGELLPDKLSEMERAALAVLVVNAAPYRLERFTPIADTDCSTYFTPNLSSWRIALNLADISEQKWFIKCFNGLGAIVPIPYISDPASIQYEEVIQQLVQPVVPTTAVAVRDKYSIFALWRRVKRSFAAFAAPK